MLIKTTRSISASQITSKEVFQQRRRFIKAAAATTAAGILPTFLSSAAQAEGKKVYADVPKSSFSIQDQPTDYSAVTAYNNFYEFGTSKTDPAKNAQSFQPRPWSVTIEGEVEKSGTFDLDDLLKPLTLEERIYRLRCVEAWSMVVPWVGFSLAELLKIYKPTSKAKFVEFTTLHDPERMPGQKSNALQWPYVEALRMDEAMHPLTLMAVGLYGEVLPNQNGAPLRLVVPWKYGFKSIKSIVKIRLLEHMPKTAWNLQAPREYGFYANVNPEVSHPRWSQKRERVIGTSIFTPKRNTEPFNGYADQVAHLYSGMDLRKYF